MAGCGLFVPLVRGSSTCSVCRKDMAQHTQSSVFYHPAEKIYGTLPLKKRSEAPPLMKQASSIAPSSKSAFSTYKRENRAASCGSTSSSLTHGGAHQMPYDLPSATFIPLSENILRPRPIHLGSSLTPHQSNLSPSKAPSLTPSPNSWTNLPQEDQSNACIYRKIRGKEKRNQRSASVGEVRPESPALRSPSPPLKELPRANNFKQLLTRFQSADPRGPPRTQRRYTVDNNTVVSPRMDSPIRCSSSRPPSRTPSQNRSIPPSAPPSRRSSTPREYSSSGVSRSNSSRHSSLYEHSPLIYNRESYHASPVSCRDPSPLSHTGSTPPIERMKQKVEEAPPLTITIPTPKQRRNIPSRWVKETDIDDPLSLPLSPPIPMSPPYALTPDHTPPRDTSPMGVSKSAPIMSDVVRMRSPLANGGFRRIMSDVEDDSSKRSTPNSHYVKRSRSKDERSLMGQYARSPASDSRSSICMNIPIHLESPNSRITSDAQRSKLMEEQYQQMTLSHVNTLAFVSDRLSDSLRAKDEPLSRNRMDQLDFKDFVLKSSNPILVKGTSLFYDAILPRPGQSDYDVTIMIAPSSQYAPLMRRSENGMFGIPSLIEMEDHDGSVTKFLKDTGRASAARNPKITVMPRLNLYSFHSLAAQNLHQTTTPENHEHHVTFILIQLLSALKYLQSDGVEYLSNNFKEFLLAYRFTSFHSDIGELEEYPRLIFLPEALGADLEDSEADSVGLCKYALRALCTLLHYKMDGRAPHIRNRSRFSRALLACARELEMDKSSSLTRAKNLLEIEFWSDDNMDKFEGECEAKLWLDMRRAECINDVLRSLVDDPGCAAEMKERFHVEFLLSVSPRSLQQCQQIMQNTLF